MDDPNAALIVEQLADGVHPFTGEIFPPSHSLQHPDIVRALYRASMALRRAKPRQKTGRRGERWTPEEEKRLLAGFDKGVEIAKLAKTHQRSTWAISARLAKLGREVPEQGAPF